MPYQGKEDHCAPRTITTNTSQSSGVGGVTLARPSGVLNDPPCRGGKEDPSVCAKCATQHVSRFAPDSYRDKPPPLPRRRGKARQPAGALVPDDLPRLPQRLVCGLPRDISPKAAPRASEGALRTAPFGVNSRSFFLTWPSARPRMNPRSTMPCEQE